MISCTVLESFRSLGTLGGITAVGCVAATALVLFVEEASSFGADWVGAASFDASTFVVSLLLFVTGFVADWLAVAEPASCASATQPVNQALTKRPSAPSKLLNESFMLGFLFAREIERVTDWYCLPTRNLTVLSVFTTP